MEFQENILLREHSNLNVGGPARYFYKAKTIEELIEALIKARSMDLRIYILGGGTNILWKDEGFDGLVLKPEFNFIDRDKNEITVGAAVLMDEVVAFCVDKSLKGLEWAGGLPGSFGGAIFGNAGCFGGEIKDNIVSVKSLDLETFDVKERTNRECEFVYRGSVFKYGDLNEIIIQAVLELESGVQEELRNQVEEEKAYRKVRQPLDKPNLGSFFKNVDVRGIPEETLALHREVMKTDPFPVIPTAHLIHAAGLKGKQIGGAMVSSKHPNFIINTGEAKTKDFLDLIAFIKQTIKAKFDIELEEEVRIIE